MSAPPDVRVLLRELEASALFSTQLPARLRLTAAEHATLDAQRRRQAGSVSGQALRQLGDREHDRLRGLVRQLGKAASPAAVPLLCRIWEDCAVLGIRQAAGLALKEVGGAEANQALRAQLEDSDPFSTTLAVWAFFDVAPGQAFDHLAAHFEAARMAAPGGLTIPLEVLTLLAPSEERHDGQARWNEQRAPGWFIGDPRWVELCARLRHAPTRIGGLCASALRNADRQVVGPILAQVQAGEVRPPPPARQARGAGDLLARYLRGEHEAVWTALRAPPALDPELRAEAMAVGEETMRRVAAGADWLAARLRAKGWSASRRPPGPLDGRLCAGLERFTAAPLPPSLSAYWRVVGGLDLGWDFQRAAVPELGVGLPMEAFEALQLAAARDVLRTDILDREGPLDPALVKSFLVQSWPEGAHKPEAPGVDPHDVIEFEPNEIWLPFLGADPIVQNGRDLPLVDYLRLCFRWAGFPGLEAEAKRADVRRFVGEMTRGIEPF